MKNKAILFISLITASILWSCGDDIIEKNLEKESVTVLSPSNGYVSSSLSITFLWDEVKGATGYNLQVVKPYFSNIQQFVLDTNLTTTKFTFSFQPGNTYQWRIKAKNNSSETDYLVFSFTVDSTLSLANQAVQLISPTDGFVTNDSTQTFTWGSMALANDYRFEVLNSAGSIVFQQPALLTNTTSYTFLTGGTYQWRVQAHSDNGSVSIFAPYTIVVDFTKPTASQPDLPLNNTSVNDTVSLSWTREPDAYKDSLLIASDSLFTNILDRDFTTNTTHTFIGTAGLSYFWKLRTVDQAGNWSSGYSSTYKFKVN